MPVIVVRLGLPSTHEWYEVMAVEPHERWIDNL
jgi:hypothetical protein